jgi:hypothetical protein
MLFKKEANGTKFLTMGVNGAHVFSFSQLL